MAILATCLSNNKEPPTHAHVHILKRKEKCKYFFLRMTSIILVDFVLYIAARKIPPLWCSFLFLQSTNERDEAFV